MTVIVSGITDTSTARNGGSIGGALAQTHGVIATAAGSFPPAIETVLDDKGAKQGVIGNGGHTDDSRPQISGKAGAGVVVHIYSDSELIGKVTVGASEAWTFIPRSPLVNGRHEISVIYEYPDGDVSDVSASYVIFVDKVAPETTIILEVVDDEGRITGGIAVEGITDDSQPTVDGTTEANATVIVYDKGKEIGRAQADSAGKWSFTPEPALADGTHILEYVAVDQAGNQSGKSGSFEFVVDTRPELVNIHIADDDVGNITGTLVSGSSTDDATPTLHGTATAGGIVKIYEGNALLGETTAGVDGRWTFRPGTALSEGPHALQATVTLPAKGESDRSPNFNLVVDLGAPDTPTIEEIIDNVGAQRGVLLNGAATDDETPTLKGKAEASSTVSIYDNGNLLGSVMTDAKGEWNFTPATSLPDGTHAFTVVAEDKAGNTSQASDPYVVTIDTVPPTQTPTLTGIGKDSGFSTDDFLTNDGSAGRLMMGNLSALLGTGETLQVSTDGGQTWIVAHAEGDKWSAQDANSHTSDWSVQTRVVDAAGNIGAVAQSQAVTLDTVAAKGPGSVSVTGGAPGILTVSFDPASVNVGDRVSIANIYLRYEYTLTAADIAAGKITVSPGSLNGGIGNTIPNTYPVNVTVLDPSGNKSASSIIVFENFNAWAGPWASMDRSIVRIEPLDAGKRLDVDLGGKFSPLLANNYNVLHMVNDVKFSLKQAAKEVSFQVISLAGSGGVFEFYNAAGELLGTLPTPVLGSLETGVFTALPGQSVLSVIYRNAGVGSGSAIDNFAVTPADPSMWIAANSQVVEKMYIGGGGYYGTDEADVFTYIYLDGTVWGDEGIQGNGGIDTLKLTTADQVLDLTTLPGKLRSVEIIDITGTGNNTLKLSLADVLENGGMNQFVTDGRVQLLVKGNVGDSVILSDLLPNGTDPGDWVKATVAMVNGVTYDSYQHSALKAEILLQQGVTITVNNTGAAATRDDAEPAELAGIDTAMLTLNVSQVLNEGGMDLFHEGEQSRTQMMVKGNAGDSINLDDLLDDGMTDLGDWAVADAQTIDGVAYNVYQHSGLDAELLVQESVKVNLI